MVALIDSRFVYGCVGMAGCGGDCVGVIVWVKACVGVATLSDSMCMCMCMCFGKRVWV